MASALRISSLLPVFSIGMGSLDSRRNFQSLCIKEKVAVRPLCIRAACYLSKPLRFSSFTHPAASRETSKVEDAEETELQEAFDSEHIIVDGSSDESIPSIEEKLPSAVITSLEFYKEALEKNDQSKVAEIEVFLQSIEDERDSLENKIVSLSEELVVEKDRILRISADFDNFRKRTERVRLSLMENVQGEVVESLLPVLDNFERAKSQIKTETEGEEMIISSYQSIYKQFMEILTSIGVAAIETIGSSHVLDVYSQGLIANIGHFEPDSEFTQLQYETVGRAGNGDYSLYSSDSTSYSRQYSSSVCFNENLYSCLRALQEGDVDNFHMKLVCSKKEPVLYPDLSLEARLFTEGKWNVMRPHNSRFTGKYYSRWRRKDKAKGAEPAGSALSLQ